MSPRHLKIAILLTAALACTGWARAQVVEWRNPNGAPPDATGPAKVTVHGVVLDQVTHQPIARALVDGNLDAVLTDKDGRFELTLPEGSENLQVRRPGYTAPETGMHFVEISPTMQPLTLYLRPTAGMGGHVSLKGDDDPSILHFEAYRMNVANGHEQWVPAGFTSVDSEGEFSFQQLDAPGSFLFCSLPVLEQPPPERGKQVGFPRLCFPGGTDFASVTPLNLVAGQQAQLEVEMQTQPFYPVTLSIPGSTHLPGIQIHDRAGLIIPVGPASRPEAGTVEFRLPNGSYYAVADEREPERLYGRVDFTVANGPLELALPLLPLHPVPVLIHKEFTQNANSGGQLQVQLGVVNGSQEENPGIQLILQPAGKVMTGEFGGGLHHVKDGAPDAFEVDAQPGRWRVQVQAWDGYVTAMTSGGVDLLREPLVIPANGSVLPIDVTLRNDSGQIQCTVAANNATDEAPQQSATYYVVAIAQFSAAMPMQFAWTQSNRATIVNLAPGLYRVAAFDGTPTIDLDDPDQVSRVMAKAQTVRVEPISTATLQVQPARLSDSEAASQ